MKPTIVTDSLPAPAHGIADGNENLEFDEFGYMQRRFASTNDPIRESGRKFRGERKA